MSSRPPPALLPLDAEFGEGAEILFEPRVVATTLPPMEALICDVTTSYPAAHDTA